MDEHYSKGLWVVGLEALNHELHWLIVLIKMSIFSEWLKHMTYHVCKSKISHVKDDTLAFVRWT